MASYIVKIESSNRQVRITIPKVLASMAGLREERYCEMELTPTNTIEVRKLELRKAKKGYIQENPPGQDRSAEGG